MLVLVTHTTSLWDLALASVSWCRTECLVCLRSAVWSKLSLTGLSERRGSSVHVEFSQAGLVLGVFVPVCKGEVCVWVQGY